MWAGALLICSCTAAIQGQPRSCEARSSLCSVAQPAPTPTLLLDLTSCRPPRVLTAPARSNMPAFGVSANPGKASIFNPLSTGEIYAVLGWMVRAGAEGQPSGKPGRCPLLPSFELALKMGPLEPTPAAQPLPQHQVPRCNPRQRWPWLDSGEDSCRTRRPLAALLIPEALPGHGASYSALRPAA